MLFVLALLWGGLHTLSAERYHVKVDGDDWLDGRSWKEAFATLQKAIDQAQLGDEIWVASGTYTPTQSAMDGYDGDTERSNTFLLKEGVNLFGGFPATGSPGMAQRDWEAHPSILSGNIGHPDEVSDNVYHVVMAVNLIAKTLMDGFIICDGRANDADATVTVKGISLRHSYGGGLFSHKSSLVLQNILFQRNYAVYGGGMLNDQSESVLHCVTFRGNSSEKQGGGLTNLKSAPTLKEVGFYANTSDWGGGLYIGDDTSPRLEQIVFDSNTANSGGGGIYNSTNACPTINTATFSGNKAGQSGGGLFNADGASPILHEVFFFENEASWGGGMLNFSTASPLLHRVSIRGNTATRYGGGISNQKGAQPILCNVLISGNNAPEGGGIYNTEATPLLFHVTLAGNYAESGSAMLNNEAAPELYNCLIVDNHSGVLNKASIPLYSHCMVQGMTAIQVNNSGGEGNISSTSAETVFVQPTGPASKASVRGDYHLAPNSPAIGSGSFSFWDTAMSRLEGKSLINFLAERDLSALDLDGKVREAGVTDLGAYVGGATK
jgi:hypothetical protein